MWLDKLKTNPLELMLSTGNPTLLFFIERDLLDKISEPVQTLWEQHEPTRLIAKQGMNGSWRYRGKRPGDQFGQNYELLETWRNLRVLVEMYGFNRHHPDIEKAAEYIFSCQTEEGDIRGILSNQYTPYYMGAIMELLIKIGYEKDNRILKGFDWLLKMRQNEGGWIIPMMMFKMQEFNSICTLAPFPPKKDLPFSHMATGMVIRAFAVHPQYRKSQPAIQTGELLKDRFFQEDIYTSRKSVDYWYKFQFPFWWTDLLTVMDSLMRMEFPGDDPGIQKGLDWFIQHEDKDGGWKSTYGKVKNSDSDLWVTYAVARVLKFFLK